jgi:hypothetical protein
MCDELLWFGAVPPLVIWAVLMLRKSKANQLVERWVEQRGWRLEKGQRTPVGFCDVLLHWPVVCQVHLVGPRGQRFRLKLAVGAFFGRRFDKRIRVLQSGSNPASMI